MPIATLVCGNVTELVDVSAGDRGLFVTMVCFKAKLLFVVVKGCLPGIGRGGAVKVEIM